MIICVDFDGVVADTCATKRTWLSQRFGVVPECGSLARSSLLQIIGHATYAEMQHAMDTVPVSDVRPLVGCIDGLLRLKMQAAIHLVTARPRNRMEWVTRWLARWNAQEIFQSVHTSWGTTKGAIAGALGATCLIDNDQRHFVALPPDVLPILLDGDQASSSPDVAKVENWSDIERLVREKWGQSGLTRIRQTGSQDTVLTVS